MTGSVEAERDLGDGKGSDDQHEGLNDHGFLQEIFKGSAEAERDLGNGKGSDDEHYGLNDHDVAPACFVSMESSSDRHLNRV